MFKLRRRHHIPQRGSIESYIHYLRRLAGLLIWLSLPKRKWPTKRVNSQDLAKHKSTTIFCRQNVLVAGRSLQQLLGGKPNLVALEDFPLPSRQNPIVVSPIREESLPPDYVAYQLEPLSASPALCWSYLSKLRRSSLILDYSEQNRAVLESFGFPREGTRLAPVCPVRPNFASTRYLSYQEREIDVLFFGWTLSPRRQKALKVLTRDLRVEIVDGTYGEDMDSLIANAKVCVNIHFYDNSLLEQVRIAQCFSQGTPVVSEMAVDSSDWSHSSAVVFVSQGDWLAMASETRALIGSTDLWGKATTTARQPCLYCSD